MATYSLDPQGILETEPLVLDDGSALYELVETLRVPSASRAGVSVHAEGAPDGSAAGFLELGADELLIDREACQLAGEPAIRTLILVQLGGVATVVLEQWRLLAAGERWVVTATADLALWPRLAAGLRTAVASFEVGP